MSFFTFRAEIDAFLYGPFIKQWPVEMVEYDYDTVKHIVAVLSDLGGNVTNWLLAALQDPRYFAHQADLDRNANALARLQKTLGNALLVARKQHLAGQERISLPSLRYDAQAFLIFLKVASQTLQDLQAEAAGLGPLFVWNALLKLWEGEWKALTWIKEHTPRLVIPSWVTWGSVAVVGVWLWSSLRRRR